LNREELIRLIVEIEWDMFQRVKTAVSAPCQLQPDVFKRIRESVYETWSEEALLSCLLDFEKALQNGRNLLTEKYAQMGDLITAARENPVIDQIVIIETQWQDEVRGSYPALYNRVCRSTHPYNDGRNFSKYLKGELQTYTDRTIELYYQEVSRALERNENLALKSLEILVKKGGYNSLSHAEGHLSKIEG